MAHTDPGALIVGGHFLSLGAARNLAEHGVPVYLVDNDVGVTRFSRSVRRTFRCPPPTDAEGFVGCLEQLAGEPGLEGAVVFPSTDEWVRVLSQNRERLSRHYRVTTPPWEVAGILYDKRRTHEVAGRAQVPTPDTFWVGDTAALETAAVEFPVVLKPAITTHLTSVTKKKAYRANDRDQMLSVHRMMAGIMDANEVLVQELLPGRTANLYSYFGLFRDGQPIAGYAAKRLRQHPMEFGRASTLAVTMNLPELEDLATRFLRAVGYSGLAEVEFMYHDKHGRFELLEVNPRIWGWHSLAIHAGVDLPYLAYAEVAGKPYSVGAFRDGVKWMRLTTDVPTVLTELWHGRLSLVDYLRSVRGSRDAVFSLSDPLPFVMDLLLVPYYAKQRGF